MSANPCMHQMRDCVISLTALCSHNRWTTLCLQMYRGVIDSFKNASGLSEDAILDVRGNHDFFDVPIR